MTVLFDLDGTILGRKEEGKLRNEIAKKFQLPDISKEEYYDAFREVVRDNRVDTRLPIFERILKDKELARRFTEDYRRMTLDYTFIYPDAKEVLQNLGVKKGLVTNGSSLGQREKIKKYDLEQYFDTIVISGEIGRSKPNPEVFIRALEDLGSSPEETLYVGDSPESDVSGAGNAGITSVLIIRDTNPSESEPDYKPDYKIKDMRELYDIVGEINDSG